MDNSQYIMDEIELAEHLSNMTEKQISLAQEYIIDFNKTQAGWRSKYKTKNLQTAANTCQEILRLPAVDKYVKHLIAARSERTNVTADKVVLELAKIAFAKPSDFLTIEGGSVKFKDLDDMTFQEAIAEIKITEVSAKDGSAGVNKIADIKMHSKLKALELLAKHTGALIEKVDVTSGGKSLNIANNIIINHRSPGRLLGEKAESDES